MKKLNVGDIITINSKGLVFLEKYEESEFIKFLGGHVEYFDEYLKYFEVFRSHYGAISSNYKNFRDQIKIRDYTMYTISSIHEYTTGHRTNYYYMVNNFDKPLISELIHQSYEEYDLELLESVQELYDISENNEKPKGYMKNINMPKFKFIPIRAQDLKGRTIIGYEFGNNHMLKLTDDNKFVKTEKTGYQRSLSAEEIVKSFGRAKIKSYEESGAIFGYKLSKKEMFESNKLFNITRVIEDYESAKTGTKINIAEIDNGVKNLKFLLSDIEIVILEPKGFIEPSKFKITELKRKADVINKQVILIRDKNLPIKKASKGVLLDIWTEGSAVKGTYRKGNLRDTSYDKNSKVRVKFENKEIICKFKNIKLIK